MESYNKYLPVPFDTVNCFEVWWPVEGDIRFKGELILHIPLGEIEASNLGRIRSLNYGGIKGNVVVLRQHVNKEGYHSIRYKGKTIKVHTIIALAFKGERPEGYDVDHRNFVRYDNRIENLSYITKAENSSRKGAEGKENHKKAMYKLWSDEEFKKNMSEAFNLRWETDEEFRKQMSDAFYKRWKTDDEFRQRHSERLIERWATNEEFRNNIITAGKEANHKSVVEIDGMTGEVVQIWYSMSEASRGTGADFKKISLCCQGKRSVAGERLWAYFDTFGTQEYYAKLKKDMEVFSKGKWKEKPVLQYDMQNNFIAEYKSATEAARQFGYSQGNISSCCLGKYNYAYGSIWRYKQ